MNAPVEYRGEQQAMSSKHTGVEPTDFNEYVKRVNGQDPTLSLKLNTDFDGDQSVEEIMDSFKAGSTCVNPDGFDDYIVQVTNTKPALTVDLDPTQSIENARLKLVDELFGDMQKRIISGELDNSTPISLPESLRERLADLLMERAKVLETAKFILFSYRVDEFRQSWVSWGVLGYIPHAIDPMELPQVKKALTRIRTRGNIVGIKVVGTLPQHHYFGRDISEVTA